MKECGRPERLVIHCIRYHAPTRDNRKARASAYKLVKTDAAAALSESSNITASLEKLALAEAAPDLDTPQDIGQVVNPWNVSGAVVDGKLQMIDYSRLVIHSERSA